ncbi:MAG: hypothetical protein IKV31_01465, partial [Paludibacteraceae bacterium]|nr:hypothetical protein [Paludibacteraceae bacterium]
MTKQESVIKYIEDNYLQFKRLRHDVISDKLQLRMEKPTPDPFLKDGGNSAVHKSFPSGEDLGEAAVWREMTKQDINSIVCHCAQECDVNITSREVMTALQSDLIPDVHPLREYILSLPSYTPDQPDWIDFVAQQVHVRESAQDCPAGCSITRESTASSASDLQCSASETNYSEATHSSQSERSEADRPWRVCFKKWFVAMVASWMKDEVVNHQVLVLIGKQGIFKTTWLEHLIPPHLRAYACKLANSNELNKDERLRIAEFGLISLDEIDSMNNRELNQLKSVITATDVNERAAYAYTKERRIRLASFCASGNRRDFLTDITGNRRWLPFEVESIQNPFYTTLPYEQMYAQAWALANDEFFSYWFDLDEIEVLEQHNQHFRDESNEEQLLPILFDVPAEGRGEFMTTAQISERLVTYGNIKKPMTLSRLGVLMSSMGY